jgi:hypothetical protein
MGMSRRDLLLAERQIETNQELIDAIKSGKGKEYRKEKDELLKVLGGKARLDNIEKEEAAAREKVKKILADADTKAASIISDAKGKASAEMARLERSLSVLAQRENELSRREKTYGSDCLKLKEDTQKLTVRIGEADKREDELNRLRKTMRGLPAGTSGVNRSRSDAKGRANPFQCGQ